jgi:hypothetical protein
VSLFPCKVCRGSGMRDGCFGRRRHCGCAKGFRLLMKEAQWDARRHMGSDAFDAACERAGAVVDALRTESPAFPDTLPEDDA